MSRTGSPCIRILRGLDELASGVSELIVELPGLDELRRSIRSEIKRWDLRADSDSAARRVRDLFQALLDVIEPHPDPRPRPSRAGGPREARDPPRRAGPRRA